LKINGIRRKIKEQPIAQIQICAGREALMIDVAKILEELKQEKEQLEQAILTLERLAQGRGPRRGRPPAWMTETAAPKRRGRPPGSKNKTTAPTPPKDTAVA
jgi:hypothetical protein